MSYFIATTINSNQSPLDVGYNMFMCDAQSASFTITLPSAVGYDGYHIHFIRVDSNSSNTVTIAAANGETIDGAASKVLTLPANKLDMFVANDGSVEWRTYGNNLT